MVGVIEVVDNVPVMSVDDGEHSGVDQWSDVKRQVPGVGHLASGGPGVRSAGVVDRWAGRYVRHAERCSGL